MDTHLNIADVPDILLLCAHTKAQTVCVRATRTARTHTGAADGQIPIEKRKKHGETDKESD